MTASAIFLLLASLRPASAEPGEVRPTATDAGATSPDATRPAPVRGSGSAWEASLGALAGHDASFADGAVSQGGVAGELTHSLGVGGRSGGWRWAILHRGAEEVTGDGLLFGESLDASAGGVGGLSPGAAVNVETGGLPGWTSNFAAGTLRWRSLSWDLEARAGAGVRTEAGRSAAGPGLRARLWWAASPRFGVGAWLDGRSWLLPEAPPWSARASLAASWSPNAVWTLQPAIGLRAVGTSSTATAWAGLDLPGETVAWGNLSASLSPMARYSIVAETGGSTTLSGVSDPRLWAMAGVSMRLSRLTKTPSAQPPAPSRFGIQATAASEVALIGGFNGWTPVPMVRGADGKWTLDMWLPPGRWPYAYVVDGVAVVPDEAVERVQDDFGSLNGIIEVPER